MGIRHTEDPLVALKGLMSAAEAGVIVIGGGSFVVGIITESWAMIVGGVLLLALLSWMVHKAGQVVRSALEERVGKQGSGA